MTPHYNYDPSKVSTAIEIFPKDDYEGTVGELKAFLKKEGEVVKSYGIRFSFTIAEGAFRGKRTVVSLYLHTEGSQSMTKRFQMAAMGYGNKKEDEQEFDKKVGGMDWSFDPETGAVSEGWKQFSGARVVSIMDVQQNNRTGEPMQNFVGWRPIVGGKK